MLMLYVLFPEFLHFVMVVLQQGYFTVLLCFLQRIHVEEDNISRNCAMFTTVFFSNDK